MTQNENGNDGNQVFHLSQKEQKGIEKIGSELKKLHKLIGDPGVLDKEKIKDVIWAYTRTLSDSLGLKLSIILGETLVFDNEVHYAIDVLAGILAREREWPKEKMEIRVDSNKPNYSQASIELEELEVKIIFEKDAGKKFIFFQKL